MKTGNYYQQGDVILRKIDALPEGLNKQDSKVLQHGETTGHMHQFDRDAAVTVYVGTTSPKDSLSDSSELNFKTVTENGNKYIVVDVPALLRHEEHKPITIEPGVYEIDIVREFDYDKFEMSRVVD